MAEKRAKWSLGILCDKETDDVPGSVLLIPHSANVAPLGLDHLHTQAQKSIAQDEPKQAVDEPVVKRTANGKIILDPQPHDSLADPLNWPSWRRDAALLSLGFYCMVGGGMTPVLAAGFQNVASTFKISIPEVALTTGLYMMGLGLGSVIMSPTAILWGKRPVYLGGIILFALSSIWCALSPAYTSLIVARICMGIAVSPCECLPSATIAEIFYLHERAYRLGIYTLLLLSGKNLVPLVSAAIIESLGWRWVFWIIAIIVGACLLLVFLFVPETFFDRTPHPTHRLKSKASVISNISNHFRHSLQHKRSAGGGNDGADDIRRAAIGNATTAGSMTIAERRKAKELKHVERVQNEAESADNPIINVEETTSPSSQHDGVKSVQSPASQVRFREDETERPHLFPARHTDSEKVMPRGEGPRTPALSGFNSPSYGNEQRKQTEYFDEKVTTADNGALTPGRSPGRMSRRETSISARQTPIATPLTAGFTAPGHGWPSAQAHPKSFRQTLSPWSGRIRQDKWLRVMIRPFILFAYPAILWSTLVYSMSIGWLIVLSESISVVYKSRDTYNFTSLQAGLVYISPFVGGVLGTAVAGKVSDVVVRFMSRRHGGVYEPEFRLVMAIPIAITTGIGLMGFGWSAQERDNYMVPTVFFGLISFGCSLGSTTAITFAVDSYRQYAGEALVTLNFSKNIFHGLVFSLFFNRWLEADGSKTTFIVVGVIQVACLLTTIPMYIFGKRARMWTVRKGLMDKF